MGRRPRVLSAFSGLGGLDLGLIAAGFRIVACIERNPIAQRSLRSNFHRPRILIPADIDELAVGFDASTVGLARGELELLAGGVPCQPFSKAAQWSRFARLGLEDSRATCLASFFQIAEKLLPHAILIENVPGFARGPSSAMTRVEKLLTDINANHGTHYRLTSAILDAADYGVPQRRERAFLIALRDGTRFLWPEPTHQSSPMRSWDALSDCLTLPSVIVPPAGQWAGLLPSIPEGWNYLWHTDKGGGLPLFGYRTRFWSFLLKLAKDRPGWTLPAQPGPATGPFHWDNRPLTVPEMLRLQSFPIGWKVHGSYRDQVRLVGNATPPLLAEIVARQIGEQLFQLNHRRTPSLCIQRQGDVPPPGELRPVPGRYVIRVGTHRAHPGEGLGPCPRNAGSIVG